VPLGFSAPFTLQNSFKLIKEYLKEIKNKFFLNKEITQIFE
jgi:hypothetical protein